MQTIRQAKIDEACKVKFTAPTQAVKLGRVVLLTSQTQPLVQAKAALRVA